MGFYRFLVASLKEAASGSLLYKIWIAFLVVLMIWGATQYFHQLDTGLIATSMRDQVSWGFYIGNFTFMVGVAAAAVMLVIPAYIYGWKPIKEVAVLGEILAVSAILMAVLFVFVDIGRPDRILHLLPAIGQLNFPSSLLAWDTIVLNIYLLLNLTLAVHILYSNYRRRPYNKKFAHPLILLSIPAAISIHTVTAFLYNGLGGRPFWNASILAPKFLASAFCSGPAVLIITMQLLNRTTRFRIKKEAIWKLAELMAYAMAINLFMLGAEVFKEFYSGTEHAVHAHYLFFGIDGQTALVPYAWTSLVMSLVAFGLLLLPSTRKNPMLLNIGCVLTYGGVYIEKGIGLVIPGMTPDTLGHLYEYAPSWTEVGVGAGIFAFGFFVFTVGSKIAIAILSGDLVTPLPAKTGLAAASGGAGTKPKKKPEQKEATPKPKAESKSEPV